MIIGYGRIKHKENILTVSYNYGYKEGLLKSNGANTIFIDVNCTTKILNRPELKSAIDLLQEGDILLATSNYDLYDDINEFYKIYTLIKKKGATLKFATPIYSPNISQNKI